MADQDSTSSANSKQVAGTHYQSNSGVCPSCNEPIQHWDLYGRMPYLVGCATKYITRFGSKGGEEDLKKAEHYLQKLREQYYPAKKPAAPGAEPCAECSGLGWAPFTVPGLTIGRVVKEVCPRCAGTGKEPTNAGV